jgi:hypothetical protein
MSETNITIDPEFSAVRPIDHVVLSLPDLDQARERFHALGFNVAPVARHNFGTENAIIPFANGTFLEPLAIGDIELVEKYVDRGSPFAVRDQVFRFRHDSFAHEDFIGGFSMMAFSGANVKKDRKKFRSSGLRTGKLARVKRPGLDIRTCFALDERAGDCNLFVCERKDGAPVFNTDMTTHQNGALRVSRVIMVEDKPLDFIKYLQIVTGQNDIVETAFGFDISLTNGKICVVTREGLKIKYGIEKALSSRREGLCLATYEISVRSLNDTAMMLAQAGIKARQVGERIVVANAPGQGATMAFVEEESL